MEAILKDQNQNELLQQQGYVVIPFLESIEVKELVDYFDKHHPFDIDSMYASAHSSDIGYRMQMNNKIIEVFQNGLNKYFDQINPLGGSYIAKGYKVPAILRPHQDWNIVDESVSRSFNLWVPLVDTNQHNGGIMVLPKSHLFSEVFRGPNITCAYVNLDDVLVANMQTLNIPAGHALLYDHRLLHASGPNNTNQLRLVAVFGIIPKGRDMRFYYRENDKLGVYKSQASFFLEQNPQEGPLGLEKLEERPYHFPAYITDDLVVMAKKNGLTLKMVEKEKEIQPENTLSERKGIIHRLIQWFK
ncbi:MAG: phytanoyl-CoA dioxygenase family protein [Chitinophagales bacterium]|nr:phytanoyl-CoA dioxygenase family protein [Chitinophagales bacterium]